MRKFLGVFLALLLILGLSAGTILAEEAVCTNNVQDDVSATGLIILVDRGWSGPSVTFDCLEGWGDDWWELTLNRDADVIVAVEDCCCSGDLYEVWVDDCVIGQTPKPVPYVWGCDQVGPLAYGKFTVSLKAGTYKIKIRDFAFDDHQPPGVMCPAGYWVDIVLAPYTGLPWPCGVVPECDLTPVLKALDLVEAKLDAIGNEVGRLNKAVSILNTAVEILEKKLDTGEVVTQSDLADGMGGVYFMGAKKVFKPGGGPSGPPAPPAPPGPPAPPAP